MFCTIQKKASLFDIIGNDAKVSCLRINEIAFGDANGNSRLEISSDREYLKIYTEDNYVSVAKMNIEDIKRIDFTIQENNVLQNYTLESYL